MGVYNPLLSIASLMVLPLAQIYQHPSDMLAVMARAMGGDVFYVITCADAVIVLCGGVLTAIIGKESFHASKC